LVSYSYQTDWFGNGSRAILPWRLRAAALKDATKWLDTYRAFWKDGFDLMDQRRQDDG
jgi:hypothetical protein